MNHFEEKEDFPLEAKQTCICFAGCNNLPPNIDVGTATPVAMKTIEIEEQASVPVSSGYVRRCAQSL